MDTTPPVEGTRYSKYSDLLCSLAGAMRRRGAPIEQVVDTLRQANKEKCEGFLADRTIVEIARAVCISRPLSPGGVVTIVNSWCPGVEVEPGKGIMSGCGCDCDACEASSKIMTEIERMTACAGDDVDEAVIEIAKRAHDIAHAIIRFRKIHGKKAH